MKSFFVSAAMVAFVWWSGALPVRAQTSTPVHVFGSVRCPACLEARQYLEFVALQERATVTYHDVAENFEAAELSRRVAKNLRVSLNGYPLVVVGDEAFVGWSSETQGPRVVSAIQRQRSDARPDAVALATEELAAEKAAKAAEPPPGLLDIMKIIAMAALGLVIVCGGIWSFWTESGQRRLRVKRQ